jgi:hypothetical protein
LRSRGDRSNSTSSRRCLPFTLLLIPEHQKPGAVTAE